MEVTDRPRPEAGLREHFMSDLEASPAWTKSSQVEPRLLEILVCPVTRSTLNYDPVCKELISRAAKLAYPIRDGVPIMLPEEARPLDE